MNKTCVTRVKDQKMNLLCHIQTEAKNLFLKVAGNKFLSTSVGN